MTRDRKSLCFLSVLLPLSLLLLLILPIGGKRAVTAAVTVAFAVILPLFLKRRALPLKERREVCLLLTVIAAAALMLMYLSGIGFGFYASKYPYSVGILVKYVFPTAVTVVSAEIARSVLLAQKNRLAAIMSYIYCVLADCLCGMSSSGINGFSGFMELAGMLLLPALTSGLLCMYIAEKYGAAAILPYRLIFALYEFALPVFPKISDALLSFLKLLLPLAVLLFIKTLYARRKRSSEDAGKPSAVIVAVLAVLMTLTVGVISCQFKYGALVIATESMEGAVDKGDVIIYEKYGGQVLESGEIIVFEDGGAKIVHRIVGIENIDGQTRYYTKGDANDANDAGCVTADRIFGVVELKLRYAGYPTLWLRSAFDF